MSKRITRIDAEIKKARTLRNKAEIDSALRNDLLLSTYQYFAE